MGYYDKIELLHLVKINFIIYFPRDFRFILMAVHYILLLLLFKIFMKQSNLGILKIILIPKYHFITDQNIIYYYINYSVVDIIENIIF